jgi:hypothetical protein
MRTLLHIARAYALVVAVGFLWGQLFFSTFTLAATLAGVSGVAASILSWMSKGRTLLWPLVVFASVACIVGVCLDVWRYYTELNGPGNYYPWVLVGPLVVVLALIAYAAWEEREPLFI